MEFTFGYDVENILQVQDFVELNFTKDEYRMSRGYGDDVINFLKLYVEKTDDVRMNELWDLVECCDGEGKFEE